MRFFSAEEFQSALQLKARKEPKEKCIEMYVFTCKCLVFPDEVYRLREEVRQSPGVDRRMEQWGREVGHELSSLRGHITRASFLGNPEERYLRHNPLGRKGGGQKRSTG